MGVCNAGFELGVTGATVTTAAAEADGDAFNTILIVAGGTLVYDTTHVALGAQSCKIATGATAGVVSVAWVSPFGTPSNHYGRVYAYFTAFPATITYLIAFFNVNAAAGRVAIDATGKVRILDSANATVATSTNTIAVNQWIRLEYHWVHSTTVGQGEVKLFNTATSSSATETLPTLANKNLDVLATRAAFGINNNLANAGPFWIDSIQAGATDGYPGPAAVGTPSRMLMGVG